MQKHKGQMQGSAYGDLNVNPFRAQPSAVSTERCECGDMKYDHGEDDFGLQDCRVKGCDCENYTPSAVPNATRITHKGYEFTVYEIQAGVFAVNTIGGTFNSFDDAVNAGKEHWKDLASAAETGNVAVKAARAPSKLPRLDFHIAENAERPACLLIEEDGGLVVAEFPNSPQGIEDCMAVVQIANNYIAREIALLQAQTIIRDHINGVERTAWPEVLSTIDAALAACGG